MNENEEDEIEQRIIYNNNKLVADKIRKTLLNIRNVPGISAKRWIWELIQNAKDVKNDFGRVKIKIELKKDSLIFSHNGSYFTINNILGILQQVSSKDSKNLEEQTGKFGTGFIGTHLLSGKVNIRGIVKYKGIFKRFKIFLDRTADSSEDLLKEVHSSIIKFIKNMNNRESEYEYLQFYSQKEEDFDTSFEYIFDKGNNKSMEIAKAGIDDLKNTAPVTLSTQYKKIASITIIDHINSKITKYSNNYTTLENPEQDIEIGLNEIKEETEIMNKKKDNEKEKYLYFFSYTIENECRLLYQVDKKDSNLYTVVKRIEDSPILYRDFPLIGSDKFHFPFFLDGFHFNPLETRNGLYLNGDLNEEAIENRKIIEKAIEYSIEFTEWLLSQNIYKRYLLANTRIPEPPQKYDEIAINWFIEQQKMWRKKLREFRLLKNKTGNHNKLKLIQLPVFKNKFNITFFDLVDELNVTNGTIPIKEEAETWYNIMKTDPLKKVYNKNDNTWGFNFLFSEDDLLKKLHDFASIGNLASKMKTETNKIINWLNKLYKFLADNNSIALLGKYNLIPNRNGIFKNIKEIYSNDEANSIPEIINPIYKKIFGKELNDILIHIGIQIDVFGEYVQKKNCVDVLNELSNVFKEDNDITEENKEYLCNELIPLSTQNPKIKKMFKISQETNDKLRNIIIDVTNNDFQRYNQHIIWKLLVDYWFPYHSSLIEKQKNINGLRNLLKYKNDENGTNKCLKWLNDYIIFMKENSSMTEIKKIFPNQVGNFENIKNLRYDESIPDILKDIYNKLQSTKEKKHEIRNILLLKEINSYKNYNKYTQEEIVASIKKKFTSAPIELKTEISEILLSYLPKDNNDISDAIKLFIPYYNNLFGKNIALKNGETSNEINYEIFLRHMLIVTYNFIEKIPEKDIISKLDIIASTIEFAWNKKHEKLNLAVDPSKYKIFVNGNNKFDYMENLSFSLKFDMTEDYVKKIFEIAKSFPIECDYNNILLSPVFIKILGDYSNKFKTLGLYEICKNQIDYKFIEYYTKVQNKDLLNKDFDSFREIFFKLNEFIKNNPNMRDYFPGFKRNRGIICLKFLEVDQYLDEFIDDVKKLVEFKTAK